MDAPEGWNDPADYSLFLPEDAFDLFGEYDLHIDITDFLAPELEGASTVVEAVEWERQEPATPKLNIPSEILTQLNDLNTSPETVFSVPDYTSAFAGEPFQGPISEKTTTNIAEGFEPKGETDMKARASKRKFLSAFSAESGEEVPLHIRKPFSKQRRQVVALNRMIGVCIQCKLRKVAVRITNLI
jgi:hypothetical protein